MAAAVSVGDAVAESAAILIVNMIPVVRIFNLIRALITTQLIVLTNKHIDSRTIEYSTF